MAQHTFGNTKGLSPSELRRLDKLFVRTIDTSSVVTREFARELLSIAQDLNRRVGVLISREGHVEEVMVGTYNILYLPDLGRYRLGVGRIRRLRLVFSDIGRHDGPPVIPSDIMTDLEKLRLDMVVSLRSNGQSIAASYSHLVPPSSSRVTNATPSVFSSQTEHVGDIAELEFDFGRRMTELEGELASFDMGRRSTGKVRAMLVAVGTRTELEMLDSLRELRELAETAGVEVSEEILQRRAPDPKSVLGKGKLEEVVLLCLRYGIDLLIFDTELRPTQWRNITNATDLKILDRSMVILDIFAQRAQSSEGRLQVELAQLKYNLPRLAEQDSGLSRLAGGIGGRGPGETKLEISRRRTRDRITDLERRIGAVEKQRAVRRKRRQDNATPLVAIVGYTNAGKSTLFNALTQSKVLAENRLFATLDPFQRRASIERADGGRENIVISDTVGFIRDLPQELMTAFRATLEELYDAALLIHLVDVSDPSHEDKQRSVEAILGVMELTKVPTLLVGNKCDLVDHDAQRVLLEGGASYAVVVAAESGQGLAALKTVISDALAAIG